MEDIALISRQEPGIVAIDNFEELKTALQRQLDVYKSIAYTEDSVKDAKKDKSTLTKLKKSIEDRRKEIKAIYMRPYTIVEAQAKELMALIDEPLAIIGEFIAGEEAASKAARRAEIKAFYDKQAHSLGELAEPIYSSPTFFDKKWENKSTSVKSYQDAISEKIAAAARDISSIQATGNKYTAALLNKYFATLSLDGLADYKASLEKADTAAEEAVKCLEDADHVVGYKVLRLTGTQQQFSQIIDQMELLGIEIDEIEDGMPQPMQELDKPDFISFVAFDIETTGTFGAANNDAPPDITEIGAVKVVNGEIVDRFSQLANPKRQIVPRIARLTNITNEMVADQPPVNEVIQKFKEFIGDSVLVGHNIKNCDIPYISKAAKRAGVSIENPYFDTYRFAKMLMPAHGWKNVKLEYLSAQFGIEQPDAHRAWCDAEANVGVYFKLQEMGAKADDL